MLQGIQNSQTTVVFITKRYAEKVNSPGNDNCKKEFSYAVDQLGVNNIIPVVMEQRMSDPKQWTGRVGFELGRILYVKMWEDSDLTGAGLEHLIEEILRRAPQWRKGVTPRTTPLPSPVHNVTSKGGWAQPLLLIEKATTHLTVIVQEFRRRRRRLPRTGQQHRASSMRARHRSHTCTAGRRYRRTCMREHHPGKCLRRRLGRCIPRRRYIPRPQASGAPTTTHPQA